ncbi:MAG: hypothetical protein ACLUD2_05955 [Clostridium sp.]
MRNLVRTGDIAEVQFCYHDLPEKLDLYDYDAFNRSKNGVLCSLQQCGDWKAGVYPHYRYEKSD